MLSSSIGRTRERAESRILEVFFSCQGGSQKSKEELCVVRAVGLRIPREQNSAADAATQASTPLRLKALRNQSLRPHRRLRIPVSTSHRLQRTFAVPAAGPTSRAAQNSVAAAEHRWAARRLLGTPRGQSKFSAPAATRPIHRERNSADVANERCERLEARD